MLCVQISITPSRPPEQDEELYPAIPAGISACFVLKAFLSLESKEKEPGAKRGGKEPMEDSWGGGFVEPRRGWVGDMGRGGKEDGEGLFMSRNAEGSGIGLGFSREVGRDSRCPWEEAGAELQFVG